MTKTTLTTLVNYLTKNPIAELADATTELVAEYEKNAAKARANRDLYAAAHDVVMGVIDDTPRTVQEIFDACESELPDGFSKSKIQYALREYWANEVNKIENAKSPNQFTKA